MWSKEELKRVSMFTWFPVLEENSDLFLPVFIPLSRLLRFPEGLTCWNILNFNYGEFIYGENDKEIRFLLENFLDKIMKAVEELINEKGEVFLRTDQSSDKWDFDKSCYLVKPDRNTLRRNLFNLIDTVAGYFDLPVEGVVVRKYVEPFYKFRAFWGLPIAKERRIFVKNGRIEGYFPYWVEDSIRFWNREEEPEGWRKQLAEINTVDNEEKELLQKVAVKAGSLFEKAGLGDYWSIDFMQGADGKWYLIDCAPGHMSWHLLRDRE